jgi:hypothetical protein
MRVWSLILREKHRIRVFQKNMLRRVFGSHTEEVTMWRRLYVEHHTMKMYWEWGYSFIM